LLLCKIISVIVFHEKTQSTTRSREKKLIKVISVSASHLVGEIQGVGDVLRNRRVANIRINGGDPEGGGRRKEMVNASFTYLQIREGQANIDKHLYNLFKKYNEFLVFRKKVSS
jgi:hypothetical protein